ncbi:MAG: GSCFA domain-containing protein [Paracoccaceae bacterium]
MPYSDLPPHAFWRLCRDDPRFRISDIYAPKCRLAPGMKVATAGSCFAQNIGKYIRTSRLHLVDAEPAPRGMAPETARRFGFGLFSARYGNVYTARQLRQLFQDAWSGTVHDAAIWQRDGRVYDGLRPNTDPRASAAPPRSPGTASSTCGGCVRSSRSRRVHFHPRADRGLGRPRLRPGVPHRARGRGGEFRP